MANFHFFFLRFAYNAVMKSLKTDFLHFLLFSFFVFVPCTTSFAAPGSEIFPPFPMNQELHEEDFSKRNPPPPKDSEKIMNYRGNRTYSENLPLKINQIKCTRKDSKTICLEISFNQSINPLSVKQDSFLIDNKFLPGEVRFAFNKKGDTIRMFVPETDDSFSLRIQNISSFNGSVLESVERLQTVN